MRSKADFVAEIVLILFALICLAPILILIMNSVKSMDGILNNTLSFPKEFRISNYAAAWKAMEYQSKFFNSLLVSLVPMPFIIFFSSMAAYSLARTKTKLSSIIFFIFISSMLIPFQTIMVPIVVLSRRLHIIDNLLGLIIFYVAFGVSFAIFLYHGFIKGIPHELDEAAKIDGCNKFKTYFFIIFPLVGPISIIVVILNVLGIWNDLMLPLIMISTPEKYTLPLEAFQFTGQFIRDWDKQLPADILLGFPAVIFFLCFQKYIIGGVASGAVKG